MTIALARELAARGLKPAIVTRGYRGRLRGPIRVRAGHRPEDVGDEALLMARISGTDVIKSPDRVQGALFAKKELGADLVLLDDGFQHRRIHRDLDIVLVSGDVRTGALLPAGSPQGARRCTQTGGHRHSYQGCWRRRDHRRARTLLS